MWEEEEKDKEKVRDGGVQWEKQKGKEIGRLGIENKEILRAKLFNCEEYIFWNKMIVGCTWDSVSWGNYFLAFLEKFIFLFFWLPNTGNKLVEK